MKQIVTTTATWGITALLVLIGAGCGSQEKADTTPAAATAAATKAATAPGANPEMIAREKQNAEAAAKANAAGSAEFKKYIDGGGK